MEFVRSKRTGLTIDMAPLIDVVFQLLIFFMLTASFVSPSMKLSLPVARPEGHAKTHRLTIVATADERLWIDGQPILIETLVPALRRFQMEYPEGSVRFEGDARIPYRLFIAVMDALRQANVQHVDLAHAPRAEDGEP
jgi:biopolymer transport protein ExbD